MNEITIKPKAGLTDFAIKYLAMIFMIMDHIRGFFEYTGRIPLFFNWVGRLAAPMFLFCLIEGFFHTHNRKRYFLQIYGLSILMGLIQFSFYNVASGLVRADGFIPLNQMMASFSILLVVLQGFEWCREKKWGRGLAAILIPVLLPYVFGTLFQVWKSGTFLLSLMMYTVTPLHTVIQDGGTATLIVGVVLYLTHKRPKLQAAGFVITVLLLDVVVPCMVIKGITLSLLFTQFYEWMEVFAVIFLLCYNGERGHGSKRLFYWFYPAHIYALYALSCVVFPLVK
ncbi:MAG: TraX family protein [Lachnospiraceae bacterium]|nr:TraX family protein [Lachnospiraceae bacterium]